MCGRPLAFRRTTDLISHLGEAKPRLGTGQRKERSRKGGAFPHIGRQSRESRFRDADSNWAISAVLKIPPDIFAREALANARVSDQLCIGARISTFNGNHVFVLGGRLGGYGRHQFISLRRNRSAPSDYGA